MIFQSYVSMLYIRIDVRHLCLMSIAKFCDLRTWRTLENVESMMGTREAVAMATESGGAAATGDETAATAGDETAATGGVMYTYEGELEFDEDEMAALEGQRLVAELFPDSGSEPDSKASMRVSRQEISVAETTVDRKRSPSWIMMKA